MAAADGLESLRVVVGVRMAGITRRSLVQSSAAAVLGLCAPQLWGQARTLGHAPAQTVTRAPSGFLFDFADQARLSRAYTLECAQTMPEAKYFFRPVPEERTFGQQMVHVAESWRGIYEMFIDGKEASVTLSEAGQELVKSKGDVLAQLRDSFDFVDRAVARLSDAALEVRVQFIDNREVVRRRVLEFMLDHTTHHRAQCVVYMRINGVRPPVYRA